MKRWPTAAGIVLAIVVGFVWWRNTPSPPHEHELQQVTSPEGDVYWTCPMHPQIRLEEPANCPICGMKLVKRVDASPDGQATASPAASARRERRILYWYDPMRPDQHFDKPGKSPFMDMELVPKYAHDAPDAAGLVSIDPRMAQNFGVRTALVTRRPVSAQLRAVGSVAIDETRLFAIEARAAGWVEKLDVRAVGDPVRRGQRVAGIYSPELFAGQSELILAARSGDETLAKAARQRLSLLGMPERQISQVLSSGQPQRHAIVVAPADGVVTELNVREGQQTSASMPLMRIADLSTVWVVVEVPEAQAGALQVGSSAQATLRALPGKLFEGKVSYVYPQVQTTTRTLRARAAFDNPEGQLKPGMFADLSLGASEGPEALVVPSEAVIRTGTRTVVIVAEAEGRYRPVSVDAGAEVGNETIISSGLTAGQKVVVSGQFLLDSEAALSGAFNRIEGIEPAAKAGQ